MTNVTFGSYKEFYNAIKREIAEFKYVFIRELDKSEECDKYTAQITDLYADFFVVNPFNIDKLMVDIKKEILDGEFFIDKGDDTIGTAFDVHVSMNLGCDLKKSISIRWDDAKFLRDEKRDICIIEPRKDVKPKYTGFRKFDSVYDDIINTINSLKRHSDKVVIIKQTSCNEYDWVKTEYTPEARTNIQAVYCLDPIANLEHLKECLEEHDEFKSNVKITFIKKEEDVSEYFSYAWEEIHIWKE